MSDTTSGTIELALTGLTCGGCASRVEDALASVPGVTRVHVDLARSRAKVEGRPEVAALIQAVQRAGYGARLG